MRKKLRIALALILALSLLAAFPAFAAGDEATAAADALNALGLLPERATSWTVPPPGPKPW